MKLFKKIFDTLSDNQRFNRDVKKVRKIYKPPYSAFEVMLLLGGTIEYAEEIVEYLEKKE